MGKLRILRMAIIARLFEKSKHLFAFLPKFFSNNYILCPEDPVGYKILKRIFFGGFSQNFSKKFVKNA